MTRVHRAAGRTPFFRQAVLTVLAVFGHALWAPARSPAQQRAGTMKSELLTAWSDACTSAEQDGDWNLIAQDLEKALQAAGDGYGTELFEGHLRSIKAAAEQAATLPADPSTATGPELVSLLSESRLLNHELQDYKLLTHPLHLHSFPRRMHWESIAQLPESEMTDPAVRVYMRGPEMIPYLLDALNDMTATRTVFDTGDSSARPPIMFRRCDLAIALIEAIARCKFYEYDPRTQWFSLHTEAFRLQVRDNIREWLTATKDMTPLDARRWLINRVDWEQAYSMIRLFEIEGDAPTAIVQLHRFIKAEDGSIRLAVAQQLAELHDRSGIELVIEHIEQTGDVTRQEAELIVSFGGRRGFEALRDLLIGEATGSGKTQNDRSRTILAALERSSDRLAIPVYAALLDPEDSIMVRVQQPNGTYLNVNRADLAAQRLQLLTGRDFGHSLSGDPARRADIVQQIREWWDGTGQELYGFDSAGQLRSGGIR